MARIMTVLSLIGVAVAICGLAMMALKAGRDPAWVADGYVSDKWMPLSPITGRLDAFEWKVPFDQLEGPVEEGTPGHAAIALETLPPVSTTEPRPSPSAPVAAATEALSELNDACMGMVTKWSH